MRKLREAQERDAQRLKEEGENNQIFGAGGEVLDIEPVGVPPIADAPVVPPVPAAAHAPMDVDDAPRVPKPKMKLSFKFGAKK